jgi:catechol 2,3-dioxygenase-like lactoylglutathione lyase family enzyme
MLADHLIGAVVPVTDLERARRFYSDTLGLKIEDESESGLTFSAGAGTQLFAYPTPHAGKAQHTLAGWMVTDLASEMEELRGRGVTFEDYDTPEIKTADGVFEIDGFRGAWFKDPDGNILSIGQPG